MILLGLINCAHNNKDHVITVSFQTDDSVIIKIFDGKEVYSGVTDLGILKPKSLKVTLELYRQKIIDAISSWNSVRYSATMEVLPEDRIKFVITADKVVLMNIELLKQNSPMTQIIEMFRSVSTTMHDLNSQILSVRSENISMHNQISEYTTQLEKAQTARDNVEGLVLSKMCSLLNSKKEEIVRLRARVEELQYENEDISSTGIGHKDDHEKDGENSETEMARGSQTGTRRGGKTNKAGAKKSTTKRGVRIKEEKTEEGTSARIKKLDEHDDMLEQEEADQESESKSTVNRPRRQQSQISQMLQPTEHISTITSVELEQDPDIILSKKSKRKVIADSQPIVGIDLGEAATSIPPPLPLSQAVENTQGTISSQLQQSPIKKNKRKGRFDSDSD